MNRLSILATGLILFLTTSCNRSDSGMLFDGKDSSKWNTSEGVSIKDNSLTFTGQGAKAILKDGKYKDFELTMEVKTSPGAKGDVWFHTDNALDKGYCIAINNDRNDPVWWKMTGSLESVRNLTKSFVKENEWFKMRIAVEGKAITVDINGEPVVEYIEPTAPYRIAPNTKALLSEGTFAIVNNSGKEIQCRNITVNVLDTKTLDTTTQQVNAVDEQKDEIIRLHQEDFPVLDYHVHLKGGLTKEGAARQSRHVGINYAIAPNCGIGFPITNDDEIMAYLDSMRTQPFILAMQAEGREWVTTFSPEKRSEFDYVFTDALTFTDDEGHRTRLWIPEETWIGKDQQKYMDMIVDRICMVLKEPMDIYVNPCFLPAPMDQKYDEFWTEARMNKFITALKESGKALEINARYEIPNKAIIQKAKAAGIKFTFGTNNVVPEVSLLEYCIRMKKECGITANDMYKPKIKI
ncbi:DUF1080 domain-containing protein [Parabacteroides bouchesdurhonensis]|uniref:DUF1080 domain-containing protein n=1 Tax=Parabacteroides bouchesdurhonensis TaxID=1936995 RepID=UPI000C847B8F|nr:DUF1080 domain-containing protein [Parabacteroides bouchesdurhonensis]